MMGRRKKLAAREHSVNLPWYKSLWAGVSAVLAAIGLVVINLPAFLEGAEKSPSGIEQVLGKLVSWHYEDESWTGLWSSDIEGYVDSDDMNLSIGNLKVHLVSERGIISGEISSKPICKGFPLLDYLLLDGEISWGKLVVTAYDFVGGKRQDVFKFTAEKNGMLLVLKAVEPASRWIPQESRIALHPDLANDDIYPLLHGSCAEEKAILMNELHDETANSSPKLD